LDFLEQLYFGANDHEGGRFRIAATRVSFQVDCLCRRENRIIGERSRRLSCVLRWVMSKL
jgi:hypothetical protein